MVADCLGFQSVLAAARASGNRGSASTIIDIRSRPLRRASPRIEALIPLITPC